MLSEIVSHTAEITVMPLSIAVIAAMAVMAIVLCASALLSGSELAFFSLSAPQLKLLRGKKGRLAPAIIRQLDNPQNLYTTILVAKYFANICFIVTAIYCINSIIVSRVHSVLFYSAQALLIASVLLFLSEVLPKAYASRSAMRVVFFMVFPIKILSTVLKPITKRLTSAPIRSEHRFSPAYRVSIEDLSEALDLNSNDSTSDKEILTSIMRLQKTHVSEIMKPRTELVAADIALDFGHVMQLIRTNHYSRIPVYSSTIDNIKGVLYVKDLIAHLEKPANFSWQSLIRPPYYVPETKKIDSLLEEFQKRRIHIATVVDEYGGTAGIVTLDDIIEEIVGELHDDEEDVAMPEFMHISDTTYMIEGRFLFGAFCKLFNIETNYFDPIHGDADTLAGLILEIKGDFPELHEEIRYKNFIFKIESEDERRIKRIKVTKTQ